MCVDQLSYTSSGIAELAILIMITADGTHTGLLYRTQSGLFILDQMWHELFRVKRADSEYACVIPSFLPEEFNNAVGICELLVSRRLRLGVSQRLPLGFGQPRDPKITRGRRNHLG